MSDSRAKNKFSRVIQVVLSGKKLKDFDAERVREEDTESSTARDLIIDGLKFRKNERESREKRPEFFRENFTGGKY